MEFRDPLMDPVDAQISQSIACYQEMTGVFERIRKAVAGGSSALKLNALAEEIKTLDTQARSHNTRFQELASETGARLEERALYGEWRALAARVRDENKEMARQLRAAMAVAKDELDRMDSGRQMLAGYKSGRAPTGRQINIQSA